MKKLTIDDYKFSGKKVLMRADFNVPLKDGVITDDTRIDATLPTIKKIIKDGGKLILMSHLGRPKGKVNPDMSLSVVAQKLSEKLAQDVTFVSESIGDAVGEVVEKMGDGDVVLLENLRFHPEEKKCDEDFSRKLASIAEVFVNDAFGTAHRAHASTVGVTKYLSPSLAGYLMQKEIEVMGASLSNPEHPFVAVIGGAKVSSKIGVLENLIGVVDKIIVGGGMAFTFYRALGYGIGRSIVEEDKIDLAKEIMDKAKKVGTEFLLPVDIVCSEELKEGVDFTIHKADSLPEDLIGLDIGPDSEELFGESIKTAKLVVLNGPMGVFEVSPFHRGTENLGKIISEIDGKTIVGGGDTIAAVAKFGLAEKMTHVSTGGGASLELMEGKKLPGIEALTDK